MDRHESVRSCDHEIVRLCDHDSVRSLITRGAMWVAVHIPQSTKIRNGGPSEGAPVRPSCCGSRAFEGHTARITKGVIRIPSH